MNLLIIGAGGHGKCCFEIAQRMKCFEKVEFVDDDIVFSLDKKVLGKVDDLLSLKKEFDFAFVAIGNNKIRNEITLKVKAMGFKFTSLVDPSAIISSYAEIGFGCVIFPNVVIEATSVIKDGCIVSANSIVHHNAMIEEYALIYSQCVIKPYAEVSTMEVIQTGSIVSGGK